MKLKTDSVFYNPVRKYLSMTYSKLKLERVAARCGSTISAVSLSVLLDDPRYTPYAVAAAAGVPLDFFNMVMAEPEPTVYAPLTASNEGEAA
jgi:hypothetical protein